MATKAPAESPQLARKHTVVEEIRAKLEAADAAVLTEYRGLTVTQIADLRTALRPAGTEYKVFKNTLARRAVSDAGRDDLLPFLEGPVAIAFVTGDAVLAAKALKAFAKDVPTLVVKGGLLGDRVLAPAEVDALAEVPPRDELLARLAGGFQAPLVKAARLFQAFTRNFAYGLSAYIDQRVAGGEVPPAADEADEPATDSEPAPPTEVGEDAADAAAAESAGGPEAEVAAVAEATGDTDTDTETEPDQSGDGD